MNSPQFAVIVAGGSGKRMQAAIPKQFLLLAGRPVIMRTLDIFRIANPAITITLVLPESQLSQWKQLCIDHAFDDSQIKVVTGGATRFLSVQRGLASIAGEKGTVAIHDGVRPLTNVGIVNDSFRVAELLGNAVVAVPLKDSIREVEGNLNRAVNREKYQLIQTPQTFLVADIKYAYQNADLQKEFTDDASVVESLGQKINLIKGSYDNIKITTPEDLMFAEAMINTRLR